MVLQQQGGYQKPENPAPISGPGALSKRTDGSPSQPATYIKGLPYGQGQATYDQQVAEPMAGNSNDIQRLDGTKANLSLPTQNPNEVGTAGIDRGLGGGSELMADLPNLKPTLKSTLQKLVQFDDSGEIELILNGMI